MNDFYKGFGSVVLGGFVGSCLGAAAFLTVEALMPVMGSATPAMSEYDRSQIPQYIWKMAGHRCDLMRSGVSYDEARDLSSQTLSPSEFEAFKKDFQESAKTQQGIEEFSSRMIMATSYLCAKEMDELIKDSAFN